MNCVVVNDASCLIDLRTAGLLSVLCALPYQIVVPLPIRESELLDFADQEWIILDDAGMATHDLTPEQVQGAFALKRRRPALSAVGVLRSTVRCVARKSRTPVPVHPRVGSRRKLLTKNNRLL